MPTPSRNTSSRDFSPSYPFHTLTPDERVVTLFLTQTHLTLKDLVNDWLENTDIDRSDIEQQLPAFLPLCWQLAHFLGLQEIESSSSGNPFDEKAVMFFEEHASEPGKKVARQWLNSDSATREAINKANPAFLNECQRLAEMFQIGGGK